jgi:hypothetical protein
MAGFLSLRPSEFVQGGLIDDVNGKITDAKFLMYDYNGKSDVAAPALGIEIELEDGTKHESYYSAGDAKYWVPTEDGKGLQPVGDKSHLTNSCKLALFLAELVNAGFSEDKLATGDITVLVGLTAHFQRKADPQRKGLVRKEGDNREQSTLVVTKILAMPGEAVKANKPTPKGAPTAASTGAGATTASTTTSADVDDDAIATLMEVVTEAGGSAPKNKLSQLVFKKIVNGHPLFAKRSAITQRVFNDEFLKTGAANGLWRFDGSTVTIG